MKSAGLALFAVLAGTAFAQPPVPEIPFESVPDFFKLPDDLHLGEMAGVAVNSKGHVFVFSRGSTNGPAFGAAAAQVLEFDADGKYVREIGKGLYAWAYAHTIRIDRDDNLWAIDKGSDMVIRFNPQGRVSMVFGRKKEASDHAEPWERPGPGQPRLPHVDGQFRQPTDVTWDPQGNIYISDGYVNSRIAKYDANGDWVKSWGEFGAAPGQFNLPHSIAADAQGNIYVADRGNYRIQVFNGNGDHLRDITVNVPPPAGVKPWFGNQPNPNGPQTAQTQSGTPWAICISPGPTQYLYASDAFPGRIYKLTLDGKVVGMLGKSGRQLKQFGWIHEIACPSENELYVAEILNWRVQKLVLKPR
jgi:DNA-binding beta-propeller fold protein YncE